MKKLLFFFISLLFYACGTMMGAQAPEEMRQYEQVIEVPSKDKDALYIKANGWFVENFNSAESVIEFQDKDAGKIMGKYVFGYTEGVYHYLVKQTVNIDIKDERLRIQITNPLFRADRSMGEPVNSNYRPLTTEKGVANARNQWRDLVQSLEGYLTGGDDW